MAEAEYNIPIPLGSPLNYFGGDRSKASGTPAPSPIPPPNYADWQPNNAPCTVRSNGQASGSIQGQWVQFWIWRSEEHTSELQSLMRISYAVFCLTKKNSSQTT